MDPAEVVPVVPPAGMVVPLAALSPDPANTNTHPEESIAEVAASLRRFGQRKPILVRREGDRLVIVAGEGAWRALERAGCDRAWVVESDGLDAEEAAAYAIADNETARLSIQDRAAVRRQVEWLRERGRPDEGMGMTAERLREVFATGEEAPGRSWGAGHGRENERPEEYSAECLARWPVESGQVWRCGQHRVACRDAREPGEDVLALLPRRGRLLLTDPPYCSGGFQEAARSAGTWGEVASDALSTRGYQALLRQVLAAWRPGAAYVFTDWRMWISLYDVVEGSGLPVCSMIVWSKGAPGLGGLWRPEHELVMFADRSAGKRLEGQPAIGNVLEHSRTGNRFHYTEKPVELVAELLGNDEAGPRGKTWVVDPFAGSGTTMLACEHLGRPCLAIEVEPAIAASALGRWRDMTGEEPRLDD